MRRWAKKPKILKLKIKLAWLIRKHWEHDQFHKAYRGYYWRGTFKPHISKENRLIYIYYQLYIRKPGVNYIRIDWDGPQCKALTITEIRVLLKEFELKGLCKY